MNKFLKFLAGIAWIVGLFLLFGWLFGETAVYVAIFVWLGCLIFLYIYTVREYGFKHAWRVSLFLSGLIPEIREDIRQELLNKPKIK